MTAPKRWPKVAENARMESIAAASEAGDLGQDAKRAIRAGKRELAMYLVSEMQLRLKEIHFELVQCKR
jgi:hypothetical protein